MQQRSTRGRHEAPPAYNRRRRRWSIRPYIASRLCPQPECWAPAAVVHPCPFPPQAQGTAGTDTWARPDRQVLGRVADGLRRLDEAAPPPRTWPAGAGPGTRRQAARRLAVQLAGPARELLARRPGAWAPAECNAPDPDRTTTAPLEVVEP